MTSLQRARPRRWHRIGALGLVLAAGACTTALDLDGYTFQPVSEGNGGNGGNVLTDNLGGSSGTNGGSNGNSGAAGTDDPGPGNDAGVPDGGGESGASGAAGSGNAGASGAAGSGNAGAGGYSGSSGTGGYSGSSGSAGASGSAGSSGTAGAGGSSGTNGCDAYNVCVPTFPGDWTGPVSRHYGASASCPSEYPSFLGDVSTGFRQGTTNCSCSCYVDPNDVTCRLTSDFLGGEFIDPDPVECDPAPVDDDCVNLVPDASCTNVPFVDIQPNTWSNTDRLCGTPAITGACTGGTCYPDALTLGYGDVCIVHDGDVACPTGFDYRYVYFTDFDDQRSCTGCTCELQGDQACQMDLEVCGQGVFIQPLHTYAQTFYCLAGDGETIGVDNQSVVDPGNCDAYGGVAQGSATPIDPLTVCCL